MKDFTNVAMQEGVRRIIAGCAEIAGDELLIPQEVLELVPTRYRRLACTRAKRITAFTPTQQRKSAFAPAAQKRPPTEELEALAATRTLAFAKAFATWATEEATETDDDG